MHLDATASLLAESFLPLLVSKYQQICHGGFESDRPFGDYLTRPVSYLNLGKLTGLL
jgi:hypothetical protein